MFLCSCFSSHVTSDDCAGYVQDCFHSLVLYKQKTAYDLRISDWSADVCASDLCLVEIADLERNQKDTFAFFFDELGDGGVGLCRGDQVQVKTIDVEVGSLQTGEIGRASCRESVCPYVYSSVVAATLNQKTQK